MKTVYWDQALSKNKVLISCQVRRFRSFHFRSSQSKLSLRFLNKSTCLYYLVETLSWCQAVSSVPVEEQYVHPTTRDTLKGTQVMGTITNHKLLQIEKERQAAGRLE